MINNKMIKWRKLALGVLTVTGSLLYSQQTLTLKQAIEYALQNKSDALKAKLEVTNADYKIAEAKAGALPKITGTANLTYNPIYNKVPWMLEKLLVVQAKLKWLHLDNLGLPAQVFSCSKPCLTSRFLSD